MSRTELQQHIDPSSTPWLRTHVFFERLAQHLATLEKQQQTRDVRVAKAWLSDILKAAQQAGLYLETT
jgi:hypothetical protein